MTSALRLGATAAAIAGQAIVGESDAIKRMRGMIDVAARTSLPVLIQGPTGAGKELVAAAIHDASGRTGAFVPFNVCAISDAMFEDAVFGHVRGAFTGAIQDSAGFLREADGGTVFLDEVSGLAPVLQAKLLRAIETGVFRPVGARRDVRSSFRVVAATNERVDLLVQEGRFRSDFAHRLGAITIVVPPLAERLEDVPLLVRHFLLGLGVPFAEIHPQTIRALTQYDWPGNVRELRHIVEWAAAVGNGVVCPDTVARALGGQPRQSSCDGTVVERQNLIAVLARHAGNTQAAAEALGVHRGTLYRWMKRLGIRMDSQHVARISAQRRAMLGAADERTDTVTMT